MGALCCASLSLVALPFKLCQNTQEEGRQKDRGETWMDGDVWEGRRNQVSTVEMKNGRGRVLPGGGSAGVSVGFSEFEA